jgi:hypothetical protein
LPAGSIPAGCRNGTDLADNWDAVQVALALIARWGAAAAAVVQKRVAAHREAGEEEGAAFWDRVLAAIRLVEEEDP